MSLHARPHPRPKRHRRIALAVYLVLLTASHLVQWLGPRGERDGASGDGPAVTLPAMTATGRVDGPPVRVVYSEWGSPVPGRTPVVILHGSPGTGLSFFRLGGLIAENDRLALAPDLPGFKRSTRIVPDYSIRAHARYILAFMDNLDIHRAHIVGWSMGGGVGLEMAALAPERVASLAMVASIGEQETEGSGSFHFEQAKYRLGLAAVAAWDALVPDFGLVDTTPVRSFVRNFLDTDQRPLKQIMASIEAPVLIVHGRQDPLIADWAAERHHEIIPTSRLVMTPHSHFLPVIQYHELSGHLLPFFDRHDAPGVAPETGVLDLAPRPERTGFAGVLDHAHKLVRSSPWWGVAPLFALLARLRRETATALAGVFVGHVSLDFGVAFIGLLAGRALHPCEPWEKRGIWTLVTLPAWAAASLFIAQLLGGMHSPVEGLGAPGFVVWIAGTAVVLNFLRLAPTHTGRRRIAASVRRLLHHEWWPTWALYAPILPHLARLAIRHRSLTCWTCVNPGIQPGGGIVGESKQAILDGFDHDAVLPQRRVTGRGAGAARAAALLVQRDSDLGGYPVIVKPEAGQRGAGVVLARNEARLVRAVESIPGPVLLQRYHPGPIEVGVFWVRDGRTIGAESADKPQGRVIAVTRKVFPEIEGDGVRAIRRLILDHPRFNLQARVYFENLGDRLDEVPPAGERVVLTTTGNHARGCRFEDGGDLLTPELVEEVDRVARSWRGPGGEPFDFGRFDFRASSEDDLRAGRGLAVIECNGVTSEATNLYDPSWSALRALGLLARQWSIAFELGSARRDVGVKPLGAVGLLRIMVTRFKCHP